MRPITAAALVAALALAACGSDDDDDLPATDASQTAEPSDPATTSGPADETSLPAPGTDPDAIVSSSEPGGPTPLVAGLWDASDDGAPVPDEYVSITGDGLWTYYALNEAIGNCYEREGPFGLTRELETEYSLADGADTVLTLVVDGDTLRYREGDGGEEETWERVAEGTTVESLGLETQACGADAPDGER